MKEIANLQEMLTLTVEALGFELWGMVYMSRDHGGMLRIYIDSPAGITVSDCERVSRQVSAILDVEDPIVSKYTLEVSSPGMDRPLFTEAQFARYIGSQITLRLQVPLDNRRQFKGYLLDVTNEKITLCVEDKAESKKMDLPLANIAKANVIPEPENRSREKQS